MFWLFWAILWIKIIRNQLAARDDLFELVKCLSPGEEKHFRKAAQRHVLGGQNHYAWLFEQLRASESPDWRRISEEMKERGISSPLPQLKNYLKEMLFAALRSYHSNHDIHSQLLEGLGNLGFLFEKKQFGLLGKEIRRLKALAIQYEEHHILFKIGDYERRLFKETAQKNLRDGIEAILEEQRGFALDFSNRMEYVHLLDRVFLIAKSSPQSGDEALEELMGNPLLGHEQMARTQFSLIYFHQIHAINHQLRREWVLAQRHFGKVIEVWDNSQQLIKEWPSIFRRILGNYLGICHLLNDWDKFPPLLHRMSETPAKTLADESEKFSTSHYFALLAALGKHDTALIEKLIPEIKAGLAQFQHWMDEGRVMAFGFNISIYFFLQGKSKSFREWSAPLVHHTKTERRMDLPMLSRALGLLVTWESGDEDLLEYQLRSVERNYEKWGSLPLAERVVNWARRWVNDPGLRDRQEWLGRIALEMEDSEFDRMLGAIEIRAWIRGQIAGRTGWEVLSTAATD